LNKSQLRLLKAVCQHGKINRSDAQKLLGVRNYQLLSIVRTLTERKFVIKDHNNINLADTLEARVIMKLYRKYDIEKLLLESNEEVIAYMSDGIDIDELIKKTKLSRATIYRALKVFEELGIIKRVIMVNTPTELQLFALAKESKE